MKVGIIGTRGIPNQYGGFEQFAEHFSVHMAERGHDMSVYTSHTHPYTHATYKNVKLIRCNDPENKLGTAGQFIYDLNCIRHSRSQGFDIIFQLGYTSSTIWSWLYPPKAILTTNMDGLEWKRAKYNKATRYFLTYAERWGVKYSDYLVADSRGIQDYLQSKYKAPSVYIPYGAEIPDFDQMSDGVLTEYSLSKNDYDLLIARFEPENNIEEILKAYAGLGQKLVLIGNTSRNSFGQRMYREYSAYANIHFAGAIYDMDKLNALRHYARLYLHGHSVGGTNPSLLEAMACKSIICANDNIFNRYVLGDDAFYFINHIDLKRIIVNPLNKEQKQDWLQNNITKIHTQYNWQLITETIESYFLKWMDGKK